MTGRPPDLPCFEISPPLRFGFAPGIERASSRVKDELVRRAAAAEEQVADEFQLLSAQHRGERAASEERAADMLLESLEDELLAGEARRAEIDVQRLRLKLKRAQTARRAEGGGDGGRRPCGPPTPPAGGRPPSRRGKRRPATHRPRHARRRIRVGRRRWHL